MADVPVKIFKSRKTLMGVSPSIPSGVEGEPLPPVNPPGSNPNGGTRTHNDLQGIQGGIEGERYHLTEAEKDDIVTILGAQTITGAKTFENELVRIEGINPEIRLRASSNKTAIKFRTVANEDIGEISYNDSEKNLKIETIGDNADIVIATNGTGKVNLPNIPDGTGESLMRDTNGNIVKGAGGLAQTSGVFTPVIIDDDGAATYNSNFALGRFVKTGLMVNVTIFINVSSLSGTPSGRVAITGLPFTSYNDFALSSDIAIMEITGSTFTETEVSLLVAEVSGGGTKINFKSKNQFIFPYQWAMSPQGRIKLSGQYRAST
jgi:hypothetical protein